MSRCSSIQQRVHNSNSVSTAATACPQQQQRVHSSNSVSTAATACPQQQQRVHSSNSVSTPARNCVRSIRSTLFYPFSSNPPSHYPVIYTQVFQMVSFFQVSPSNSESISVLPHTRHQHRPRHALQFHNTAKGQIMKLLLTQSSPVSCYLPPYPSPPSTAHSRTPTASVPP